MSFECSSRQRSQYFAAHPAPLRNAPIPRQFRFHRHRSRDRQPPPRPHIPLRDVLALPAFQPRPLHVSRSGVTRFSMSDRKPQRHVGCSLEPMRQESQEPDVFSTGGPRVPQPQERLRSMTEKPDGPCRPQVQRQVCQDRMCTFTVVSKWRNQVQRQQVRQAHMPPSLQTEFLFRMAA